MVINACRLKTHGGGLRVFAPVYFTLLFVV